MTLLLIVLDISSLSAYDIKGLQPIQPNGTFSTFSANIIGEKRFGTMFSIERSVEPNFYMLSINTSYGLSDKNEILASLPYVFDYSDTDGIENINLGYKHNILQEKTINPSISFLLAFSLPGKKGLSVDSRVGGGLIISKRIGPFQGHGNIFYYMPSNPSMKDAVELRLGLDLSAAHGFNVLSELIIKKSHFADDIDVVEGRLGYRSAISSNSFATAGVGFDLKNRAPGLKVFFLYSIFIPKKIIKIKRIFEQENL